MWPVLVAAVVLRGWVCAIDGRQVPPLPTPQCPPVAQAAGRCKVTPVGTQGDYVAVVDGELVVFVILPTCIQITRHFLVTLDILNYTNDQFYYE